MTRPSGVLHANASPRDLALLRITVFALWLLHVLSTPLTQVATLPAELVQPRGVLRILPLTALTTSSGALGLLTVAAAVGCLACLVGTPAYRAVGLATLTLLLLHEGLVRALAGYLIHGRIALLFVTAIVVLAPATDALALRSPPTVVDDGRHAWGLLAASTVVTVTYAFVGAHRILRGGTEIFTGRSLELWLVARSWQPSTLGFDMGRWLVDVPGVLGLLPVLFVVTTVFETLSPLALRSHPFRRVWLPVILGFHVVVTTTMSLDFRSHVVLVLVLFGIIPWATGRAATTVAPAAPSRT